MFLVLLLRCLVVHAACVWNSIEPDAEGHLVIPSEITKIDSYAFWECRKLKSVELTSSLIDIGLGAFGFTYLETVLIPKSVMS